MLTPTTIQAGPIASAISDMFSFVGVDPLLLWIVAILVVLLFIAWLSVRFVSNDYVAIVEKLWSPGGSVAEGRIMALGGEAGYQAELLRGGVHFGYWRGQYRIHKTRLGHHLRKAKLAMCMPATANRCPPAKPWARVVPATIFKMPAAFCAAMEPTDPLGQRGRQRAILREGVYAINLAMFVVITESRVHALRQLLDRQEAEAADQVARRTFRDRRIRSGRRRRTDRRRDPLNPDQAIEVDSIGIVTVQDGPSLAPGEIIAPAVGTDPPANNYHNNYQDAEAFFAGGGRRGRQLVPLTDGTYFINRWFASVQLIPKTVVPIGYVGVVVSYYGQQGEDLSGIAFRHGERVGRRPTRRVGTAAGTGQISIQHVCRHASFSCPPPTSCCTGSPAAPKRTVTMKVCDRSIW